MKRISRFFRRIFSAIMSKPTPTPTTPPVQEPTPVEPPITLPSDGLFEFKKGMIGVDISHHNDKVDLVKLAKNVSFIYLKATEGASFVSSAYVARSKVLRTLGVPWGAYHYYRVNVGPIVQADHFLKYIDTNSGLPPVLDIESINNNYKPHHTKDLLIFLEHIEKVTGIRPMIYLGYYFAKDHIKPTEEFAKYRLWLSWYTKNFSNVKVPKPWDKIDIWQYASSGVAIEGVVGDVDVNIVM